MFQDPLAHIKYKWFVNKFDCKTLIETGTHVGHSALKFILFHDTIITCEISDRYFYSSLNRFTDKINKFKVSSEFKTRTYNLDVRKLVRKNKTIFLIKGSSDLVLKSIFEGELSHDFELPYVFYLDAHGGYTYKSDIGGETWPIRDELEIIANYNLNNSKIIIHDFKVPGFSDYPDRPWWGYDSFQGQSLDYNYIKDCIFKINPGMLSFFPDDVKKQKTGSRGILYSVPPDELNFEEYLKFNRGIPPIELNEMYYSIDKLNETKNILFDYNNITNII
jgi:hypothetical protein